MVLSPQELDAVAEGIAARLRSQPRLVDRNRLAELVGLSVATIERLTRFGKIPVIRAGSRCLYDVDRVVAELTAGSGAEDGGVK
jgi:phage terminase Nu1 subunit (DNA packaging protein)